MRLAVAVTEEDIDRGTDLPASCPVALALNRELAAAGFPGFRAEWEPYRAFCEPEGLRITAGRYGPDFRVVCQRGVHDCPWEMYEFASLFDDWYRHDPEDDGPDAEVPDRPGPITFTLDLPLED